MLNAYQPQRLLGSDPQPQRSVEVGNGVKKYDPENIAKIYRIFPRFYH